MSNQPPLKYMQSACCGYRPMAVRNRAAFHLCLWGGLFMFCIPWLAIPFLPKHLRCSQCGHPCAVRPVEGWSDVGSSSS